MFADREWNRIRELLGLLCSSLESTSWGLASIVQRCQRKFREMRGFFPNPGKHFFETDTEVSAVVTESRIGRREALPLIRKGLKFTIPVMHEFRKRGYNSRQPASKIESLGAFVLLRCGREREESNGLITCGRKLG